MNLDRLAVTIEHDRRAAHEQRTHAAASPAPRIDGWTEPPSTPPTPEIGDTSPR